MQRLYSLPERLAKRFQMYLNILPLVQTTAIYLFFIFGTLFIALSIYKYTKPSKSKRSVRKNMWLDEEEMDNKGMEHNADKILKSYLPQKRASMSNKEIEVYFNSLVAPLNQELAYEEYQEADITK